MLRYTKLKDFGGVVTVLEQKPQHHRIRIFRGMAPCGLRGNGNLKSLNNFWSMKMGLILIYK